MPGISIAYSSVHQIYQIALAAQELGELDNFYCSVIDAPGKWGSLFSLLFGRDRLINRRCLELDLRHVTEYPWPLAMQYFKQIQRKRLGAADWEATNNLFDQWAANKLKSATSQLFVGVETCALRCLAVAHQRGMKTLLDCHQVHPDFLDRVIAEAATDLNITLPENIDTPTWRKQKLQEFELADFLLVISEPQKRSFLEAGFAANKIEEITLWADTNLFYPPPAPITNNSNVLRVLFVGGLCLRKGVPYLLQAIELCGSGVELTLIGAKTSEITQFLEKAEGKFNYVPTMTKAQLREYYWQSDVLVLPSLIDTFGWVAMEAMACGLPVIVSENCGVPVPDENWRVPIMNAEAIAQKLLMLRDNREYCASLGEIAAQFAQKFTSKLYRERLQDLFKQILSRG
ncbi:glycosyltransferase family 4 protein [Nostoc sp. FACHB-152]|uniref:glycosyltransferase family 4 protein n=1 Tax=unclassified Nostoc TaxID=2593658 RepID=UPI00168457D0|nr:MULTISPECIES: glycosyltransferase [unclassified Nostoc]MBD2451089.1 glycosyltransferase family 4 protein [Nostoc sp. FACHB-152]MBD2472593.1 glycosyltransferase family 4 protein [Nostoc sp. FACHB-145]